MSLYKEIEVKDFRDLKENDLFVVYTYDPVWIYKKVSTKIYPNISVTKSKVNAVGMSLKFFKVYKNLNFNNRVSFSMDDKVILVKLTTIPLTI